MKVFLVFFILSSVVLMYFNHFSIGYGGIVAGLLTGAYSLSEYILIRQKVIG